MATHLFVFLVFFSFFLSLSGPFFQQRTDPKIIWELNLQMKTLAFLWHRCWDHRPQQRGWSAWTHLRRLFERSNQYKRKAMPLLLTTKYGFCRSSFSKGRMSGSFRRMISKEVSQGLTSAGSQFSHRQSLSAQWKGERIEGVKMKKNVDWDKRQFNR